MKTNSPTFSHSLIKREIISKSKKAFTLVELIIVITILSILATVAFVSFSHYAKDSRDAQRLSSLTNIEKGINIYGVGVGRFPIPENPTSFTGGTNSEIKQGILTKNVLPNLGSTPVDPISGKNYTYSVFGNGKYYQVAGNLETELSYNSLRSLGTGGRAFANQFKTTKVIGNYRYDPSLPSLIIGSGSDIFSPNTCFVTNGGENTTENCITKKSDFVGKNTDASLVGYWDMQTINTDSTLRDLSGNQNHGIFSGGLDVNLNSTGMIMGKGLVFDGITTNVYLNDPAVLQPSVLGVSVILEPNSISRNQVFFRKRSHGYTLGIDVNGKPYCIIYETSPLFYRVTGKNPLTLGEKYMINCNYSGNQLSLYVNKEMQNTMNTSGGGNIYYQTGGIAIGKDGNSATTTTLFDGKIDEIKIYNRVLTDEEIIQQAKVAGL